MGQKVGNVRIKIKIKALSYASKYIDLEITQRKLIFLIGAVGGGVELGPLGTAATNGLLRQPRVIMMVEKLVE
jgi:F0F1-type ATP synthase membrane subunit c/vacuolar-type H+-ATPase subunit K